MYFQRRSSPKQVLFADQERFAGHFRGLFNAEQVKQGRGNVGQFAVVERGNVFRTVDQHRLHVADGVRGIGLAGFFVDHFFRVAVIGGNQQRSVNVFDGLDHSAQALVNRGHRFQSRFHNAGMADHVAVGEIADDDVEFLLFDGVNQMVRHFVNRHFRFQVIGGNLRAGNQNSRFPGEFLFFPAVEKESDVRVFFGFGNPQLGEAVFRHHFAEDMHQRFRREHRLHETIVVDRIFGHADRHRQLNRLFPFKTGKFPVGQRIQDFAGAVGADLANLVNEAALRAVRLGRKAVNQQDLLTSFELVIAGTEKKGTVLTDTEKRIVSYHEVGHALVAALQKHSQPVSKITIVPHTSGALGYTMQMPEEEKFLSSKEELIVELQTMLGGRAAEQVVFGIATTGASNDIERATELARKMVTQYGMSDKLGLMALSTVSNPYLDGSTMMNCADSTSSAADEEIHKLLMDCYADAKKLLVEHRSLLDEIAMYLLSKETITGDEFMAYVNADSKRLTDGSEAEEQPEQTEAPSESE